MFNMAVFPQRTNTHLKTLEMRAQALLEICLLFEGDGEGRETFGGIQREIGGVRKQRREEKREKRETVWVQQHILAVACK